MKLESFVEKLKITYRENLQSIVLYGPDQNLMIVLRDVSLAEIEKSAKLCQNWIGFKNSPPLFTDPDWLESSSDVFPIEFNEMKRKYKILFGEDLLEKMVVHNGHLRLECEEQLKGKILYLREGFLQRYPNRWRLRRFLIEASSSLFAVYGGVLQLLGESVPVSRRELLVKLREKTALDTGALERLLEVREGKRKLRRGEVISYFEEYLTTLKRMAKLVDALTPDPSPASGRRE